jgi:3-deoxy-D-manno-octulosonic-acid transferase
VAEICVRLFYRWLALPLATLGFFIGAGFSRRARLTALLHLQSLRDFSIFLVRLRDLKAQGPTLLFHAASVGEFLQANEIVRHLKLKNPKMRFALSFFSNSLQEWNSQNRSLCAFDFVFPYPWDFSIVAKKILDNLKPEALVFSKTDIWPELVWQAADKDIPIFLAAATLGTHSGVIQNKGGRIFYRIVFSHFAALFAVNDVVKNLLGLVVSGNTKKEDMPLIEVLGDPKVDSALARKGTFVGSQNEFFNQVHTWCRNKNPETRIWIWGSVWPQDLELLLTPELQKETQLKKTRIVLVPHDTDSKTLRIYENILKGKRFFNFCSLGSDTENKNRLESAEILIVNKSGLLANLYGIGDFAFVGCGKGGLHNILEAIVWGRPTFFGPTYHNAPEAQELLNRGAVESVKTSQDWDKARQLIHNFPAVARARSQMALSFVEQSRGASHRTAVRLENWLNHGNLKPT